MHVTLYTKFFILLPLLFFNFKYMRTPNTKFGETLKTHISTTESPIVLEISS